MLINACLDGAVRIDAQNRGRAVLERLRCIFVKLPCARVERGLVVQEKRAVNFHGVMDGRRLPVSPLIGKVSETFFSVCL